MNIRNIAQISFLSAFICVSLLAEEEPAYTKHPLWVGYKSEENGRNPAIAGKITKEDIAKYLPEDPIIIDAGAYNGNDAYDMSKIWPKATIFAFEPLPEAIVVLKEKCENCSNIKIIKLALSDKIGYQSFYVSSGASYGSSSLLQPGKAMEENHADVLFNGSINVMCFTIDAWAKLCGLTHIDLLWLDLQGMEPQVLMASPNILKTVKVINTEVSLAPIYKDSILYHEFKAWLENQGFQLVKEDLPWKDGGDALFVRKELVKD